MARRYIFSSESVGEGHPDKVCDTISDAVLDACLKLDPTSRVACETYAKSNVVVVGGEITVPVLKKERRSLTSVLNIDAIVRSAIEEIGYVNDDDVFHANKVFISNIITDQSSDISQGVDQAAAEGKDRLRSVLGPNPPCAPRPPRPPGSSGGARSGRRRGSGFGRGGRRGLRAWRRRPRGRR